MKRIECGMGRTIWGSGVKRIRRFFSFQLSGTLLRLVCGWRLTIRFFFCRKSQRSRNTSRYSHWPELCQGTMVTFTCHSAIKMVTWLAVTWLGTCWCTPQRKWCSENATMSPSKESLMRRRDSTNLLLKNEPKWFRFTPTPGGYPRKRLYFMSLVCLQSLSQLGANLRPTAAY